MMQPQVNYLNRHRVVSRAFTRLMLAALASAVLGGALAASPAWAAGSTLYVSSSASSDPTCAAASQANPFATIAGALACAANGSTINIGSGTFAGGFTITHNVTLQGGGAGTVISDPSAPQLSLTEVTVASGHSVTLEDLTVDGSQAETDVAAASGSLTILNSTITGGVGVHGGDVVVTPTTGASKLSILRSTVSNGLGLGSAAGGVDVATAPQGASGQTTIVESTIADNQGGSGGGISIGGGGSVSVRDSTISGNEADHGGGLYVYVSLDQVSLTNTILAGNVASDGPDCVVPGTTSVTDGGHNILGMQDGECPGITDGTHGDQVGTLSSPVNPELGALANNGGPTPTMALLPGSPAINAGDPADCQANPVNDTDQRGEDRNAVSRLACDVGAYDTGGKPLETLYVNHGAKSDPACSAASKTNPFATIAGALSCASSGTLISVGAGTFPAGFTVSANVVLQGTGPKTVIQNPAPTAGGATTPLGLTIANDQFVTVKNLTVNGNGNSGDFSLGNASLMLVGSTVTGSVAGHGAIFVQPTGTGALTVLRSTIDNNDGGTTAGGIVVSTTTGTAAVNVIDSTLTGNDGGGAVGGGIEFYAKGALNVRDSTIADNGAGGILVFGGTRPTVTLTDSILAGNGDDCVVPSGVTDGGHNLVGAVDASCPGITNGVNGDLAGTDASPLDPQLGPLASNGGLTQTMAVQSGSPAIGAGNPADCKAAPVDDTDQRGVSRNAPARHTCDIGAYDTGGAAS